MPGHLETRGVTYKDCSWSGNRNQNARALWYLKGLMTAGKGCMSQMRQALNEDCNYQAIQQFITDSTWNHEDVMAQATVNVDGLLGGHDDTALLIDESGFTKKGRHSVGVERQYNGRLGKLDNCQVGVFAALARGHFFSLISGRLYLPAEWTNDPARMDRAGVPPEEQEFRTKPDLALGLVLDAQAAGSRHAWVGADASYGAIPSFRHALEDFGETFMVDTHSNQQVYLDDPIACPGGQPVEARRLARETGASQWRRVILRAGTKGPVTYEARALRVWTWEKREGAPRLVWLVLRRNVGGGDLKCSLSNADETTSLERLAIMQGQRFWIERSLQEAKGALGLGDYRARKWMAWHHHVALVIMAMDFMLSEKILHEDSVPLLSGRDIKEMMAMHFGRARMPYEQCLAIIQERHEARQIDIDRHSRTARKKPRNRSRLRVTK